MKKHNTDNSQKRVHISGPVSISQNKKIMDDQIQNDPYSPYQYENSDYKNAYSPPEPNSFQNDFTQAQKRTDLNNFNQVPYEQQYDEISGQNQNEVLFEEQIEKKAEVRTTKPPKQTKGKNLKKNDKEANSTVSQENYHYAKEKLKKDQERLKQSASKMRASKGMNDYSNPSNQNRGKSKVEIEPLPQKHNYLKKKDQPNVPGSAKRMASQRRPDSSSSAVKVNQTKPSESTEYGKFNQDIDVVMTKAPNIPKIENTSKSEQFTQPTIRKNKEVTNEPKIEFPTRPLQNSVNKIEESKDTFNAFDQPFVVDPEPSLPQVENHDPTSTYETPRPRESPTKIEKPENIKRPKVSNKRNTGIESQLVIK